MEFITASELRFPFAQDVAALARQTVNRISQTGEPGAISAEDGLRLANDVDIPFEVSKRLDPKFSIPCKKLGVDVSQNTFYMGQDINLDDWSIFSSVFASEGPVRPVDRESGTIS